MSTFVDLMLRWPIWTPQKKKLTSIIAISIGKPGGDNMLSGDGPDFKRKAPSMGEMTTLGEARKSIKRVELMTQTAVPIIYLSEILIVGKINKTIG